MVRRLMVLLGVSAISATGGYFLPRATPVPAFAPVAGKESSGGLIADKGEAASVNALRRRIRELELALSADDGVSPAWTQDVGPSEGTNRPERAVRGDFQSRMKAMRSKDPERYAQMTNHLAQWRQSRAERAQARLDFLSALDTSHLNEEARAVHDSLRDLIVRREEIEQRLQQLELPHSERAELMKELHSTMRELTRLSEEERKNLLTEMSRNLGFEGDDALEVSSAIQEIVWSTDCGFGFQGGRRDLPERR